MLKKINKKIFVLAANDTRMKSIIAIKKEFPINGIIGLSKRNFGDQISGYKYFKDFCKENKLQFIEIKDYSLKDPKDQEKLLQLKIDLILSLGWQRLIPDWLINHCRVGIVGIHGSASGITGGRGRSPLNWALIMGCKKFYLSIFFITAGIDEGKIIDTRSFELNELDTIGSLYQKDSLLVSEMIINNLKNGRIFRHEGLIQKGKIGYLPQRLPEDGAIDWHCSTLEIHNFIRALSQPYPGAFSPLGKIKIYFWKAQPFLNNFSVAKPGSIVTIFPNRDLLVKTGDGTILITDYTIEGKKNKVDFKEGQILPSVDFRKQMIKIISRHRKKYPHLPIAQEILNLAQ